jgi:hypothetical protein
VFGNWRRKTQAQLARAEMNRSIGHLRQAATHAARGAGDTVGPRFQAARGAVAPTAVVVRDRASSGLASTAAALAPLALAVRHAQSDAADRAAKGKKAAVAKQAAVSRKAKKMKAKKKSRRSGTMIGLLAAGTVAGLAGAMALRRHREQQEWAEYDAGAALEPMHEDVETIEVRTTGAGEASTGAGSSVAGGDSAPTIPTATAPSGVATAGMVPAAAEGARTSTDRPTDDLTKATTNHKSNTRA